MRPRSGRTPRRPGQVATRWHLRAAQSPPARTTVRPPRRQRRLAAALAAAIALTAAVWFPPSAEAAFGISEFKVTATSEGGAPATLAGSHPFALTTRLAFNLAPEPPAQPGGPFTDGDLRDLQIEMPPGLFEDPNALPKCTLAQFHTPRSSPFEANPGSGESCPDRSQVGVVALHTSYGGGTTRHFGVFNLVPPPGAPSQIGFAPFGVPIALTPRIRDAGGEYGLTLDLLGFPQRLDLLGLEMTIWGTPWSVAHNGRRGNCLNEVNPAFPWAKCSVGRPKVNPPLAYLTLPTNCSAPMEFAAAADSWQQPALVSATSRSLDEAGNPLDLGGCEGLAFNPVASGHLTTARASSASGFNFDLAADTHYLTDPVVRAPSQVRTAAIDLPPGLTINPSLAAGLGVCTLAQYAAETASSPPGAGCPNNSKIGDFTVRSPLFEELIDGAIYLAQPDDAANSVPGAENPFDSLFALYLIAKAPQRGTIVRVAGKLEPDPATGRLTATFTDLPQLPYSNLEVRFREGQRAPLITPSACGAYDSGIDLTPWRNAAALHLTSQFQISSGLGGGGACPSGAASPFTPTANAGMRNSLAGAYTPFYLHLRRTDLEQEITSYSAQLPPGLLGRIANIPYCPEAAIAAAKGESGTEATRHPSCPAASEIGRTVSGYGIGGVLAYAPGRLYLAGPYHGAPLSIVAVDAATVGPFDLGTIVVRSAIEVDPRNAQVSIDSAASDPIPHILDGIPLHLRDIRVYISRPGLTLNPTSCDPFAVASTLTGSRAPFTNPRDITATATVPFQASNCGLLGFAPRLALSLSGGARRGDIPTLHALLSARPGDAGIAAAAVTLPPSILLEQAHIRRPCTRPELEAEACPAASLYGHARALTPLLAQPLEGPVYLRTSAHPLPDLVAVLHGAGIRILLEGHIDSHRSGLRASFAGLPDAPLTRFEMTIYGGRKGVLVDGEDLCASPQIATARFIGQNNTGEAIHPRLGLHCPRHRSKQRRGSR